MSKRVGDPDKWVGDPDKWVGDPDKWLGDPYKADISFKKSSLYLATAKVFSSFFVFIFSSVFEKTS